MKIVFVILRLNREQHFVLPTAYLFITEAQYIVLNKMTLLQYNRAKLSSDKLMKYFNKDI